MQVFRVMKIFVRIFEFVFVEGSEVISPQRDSTNEVIKVTFN